MVWSGSKWLSEKNCELKCTTLLSHSIVFSNFGGLEWTALLETELRQLEMFLFLRVLISSCLSLFLIIRLINWFEILRFEYRLLLFQFTSKIKREVWESSPQSFSSYRVSERHFDGRHVGHANAFASVGNEIILKWCCKVSSTRFSCLHPALFSQSESFFITGRQFWEN